jgi:hypothetical protein
MILGLEAPYGPNMQDRHSVGIMTGARVDQRFLLKLERSSTIIHEAHSNFRNTVQRRVLLLQVISRWRRLNSCTQKGFSRAEKSGS